MAITLFDAVLAGMALWLAKLVLQKNPRGRLPPGPKPLPLLGNIFDLPRKEQWRTFSEWGHKYGPISYASALGKSFVVLNDVHTAVEMLDKKSAVYSDRPVLMMAGELVGWRDTLPFTRYGERLKETRKYLHGAMGTRSQIEGMHGLFEAETRAFLRHVLKRPEKVAECIRETAGSVILQLTYGYKPKEGKDDLVDLVEVTMTQFAEVVQPNVFLVDLIPPLQYVPLWFPGAGWKKKAEFYQQTLQQTAAAPMEFVKQQMAKGTARPSLVSNLLEKKNDRKDVADQDNTIKWAAAAMYGGACFFTTVSAIYSLFLAMTIYPNVQRKAQAEIDTVVGGDRLPSFSDRGSLLYVDAVVSEVFRWGALAPLGLPHTSIEDDIHEGYFIPKGSVILTNVKGMLHDEKVYADPWTFKPERFIATEERPAELDPRTCCFGFGRRICPGLNLADATVWASVAMSLAIFDIGRKVIDNVEIVPEALYGDEIISHPLPFPCTIKSRSKSAEALILSE
ncbi:cytochrome P450 [Auriscalpium vulgare]|uniref:Cytochrome P450 n=1 Tax=Auriscalpium vulgare TaxID=40419 RepID=A0ACB8S2Y3_9AGAM|nr:cytochrome P450 [Auriscalpium vulgare]